MKAPRPRLAKLVADQTLKSGLSKRLSRELAAYLLVERQVNQLESLMRDVQDRWAQSGYVEVVATSAHPLPAKVKADIQKLIKRLYPRAQTIVVSEVHDPDTIGGVRLTLANQQLDLSVQAKLNKFKQLTLTGKE